MMDKEHYRPGLSSDSTLVKLLKDYENRPNSLIFAALAEKYRSKGLVEQALEICNEGLEKHPDFVSALVVKAKCLFDLRKYADCLLILSNVLKENPENIKAEKLRADVFLRLGQRKAAIGALTRVVSLVPQDRESVKLLEQLENLENPSTAVELKMLVRASSDAGQLKDYQVESLHNAKLENIQLEESKPKENDAKILDTTNVLDTADLSDQNDIGDITFATKTVAELYIRQGFTDKARRVLELMLKKDAKDQWALETLRKITVRSDMKETPSNENSERAVLMVRAQFLERLLKRVQGIKAQRGFANVRYI